MTDATIERDMLLFLMLVDRERLLVDSLERDVEKQARTYLSSRRNASTAGKRPREEQDSSIGARERVIEAKEQAIEVEGRMVEAKYYLN